MPKLKKRRVPAYRLHNPTGQAVVTLNGRDVYLGKHNTPASLIEYDRVIQEWLSCGRRLPDERSTVVVAELLAAYLRHCKTYYRNPDGSESREIDRVKLAIPMLAKFYGETAVDEFSPLALKAIRQKMIDAKLSRVTINQRINCLRRIFRWGVSEAMVPTSVLQALQAIEGLRRGRSDARESKPVKPVAVEWVETTIQHATPIIAAMVRLQLLTGMRPGEVCLMRTCDIDTTGTLWVYRPTSHKTQWHGHERQVFLGPRAQEILKPYLKLDTSAYLFSPKDSDEWRRQQLAVRRKTPITYGNSAGTNRKSKPKRQPGERYDAASYRQAIDYACDRAFPAPNGLKPADRAAWRKQHRWHPHQLRHTAATELRKTHGLEAAGVLLGHKTLSVTELYAEKNIEAAMKIAAQVG